MKKKTKILSITNLFLILFILLTGIGLCNADTLLDVPETKQEQSNWCWAAAAQATLQYYGTDVTQCAMANWAGGNNCCENPSSSVCNKTMYMSGTNKSTQNLLAYWGVNSTYVESALSQAMVVWEINAGRPIEIAWWNCTFGEFCASAHALVVDGYYLDGQYLSYMDPADDPADGHGIALYTWVVSSALHEWHESLRITTNPPKPNSTPVAEAAVSKSPTGPYYGYTTPLTVTKGQIVNLYFFADKDVNGDGKASLDPDGWTNTVNGVSSGGKAEWNTDLNQGTPTFEKVITNPSSAGAANIGPFTYTFNDAPGTYEYQMLRITDRKGAQSVASKIRITVVAATPGVVSVNPTSGTWTTTPQNVSVSSINATRIYYTIRTTLDGTTPIDPPEPSATLNDGYISGSSGAFQVYASTGQNKKLKVRFKGYNNSGYGPTTGSYMYAINLSGSSQLANLTPYKPSGWSDKIVVSKTTGTNSDSSPLYTTDTLYVDWAVINNGAASILTTFYSRLYLDGVLKNSWYTSPPLYANYMTSVSDFSIGALSAGTHTIKIVTDATGVITESNETDNAYSKTITVQQAGSLPGGVSVNPTSGTWTTTPQNVSVSSGNASTIYYTIRTTLDGTTPVDPPEPSSTLKDGSISGSSGIFQVYASAGQYKKLKVRFRGYNSSGYGLTTGSYLYTIDLRTQINPVIAQTPMSGPSGTTFSQWGTGFTPNSTATLHFRKPDGTEYPTAPQAIISNGTFSISYTAPTSKAPGTYTWWAVDGPTGKASNSVSYTITVKPVIAQTPMSGPTGTTFSQWGTGFTANSTATLHFRKPDGTEYPTAPQAINSNGTFSTSYTAPSNKPKGTYRWWGVDGPTGKVSNTVSYTIN